MSLKKIFLIFAVLIFFIFIYFSYLVSKEVFTQIDFDTTVKLQDHLSRRFDLPFSFLSLVGSAEITGLIWFCILIFSLVKKYFLTVVSLFTLPIGLIIEIFGKTAVLHPAPPFLFYRGVLNFDFPSHYVQTSYSYPSGHMTRTSFLAAFLIIFLVFKVSPLKRVIFQIIILIFLISMVISRVYLGEHWLSDVIGGTLLGISLGIITGVTIPIRDKKVTNLFMN